MDVRVSRIVEKSVVNYSTKTDGVVGRIAGVNFSHDEPPMITPHIGEDVGDVTEADISGCYHLITAKQPTPISDTGYVTIFDSYPTWEMVGGRLVPMSEEKAQQAYLRWSAGAHQPHERHTDS